MHIYSRKNKKNTLVVMLIYIGKYIN